MSPTIPAYPSGEEIIIGDKIKFSGEEGQVEFVVTANYPNWDTYWKDLGQGVMLAVPSFGSVYAPFNDGDLEFISRANTDG